MPEAINDSVFAIMGETFGFVGLVVILLLFAGLLLRILSVADHLPDLSSKLVAIGVFGWLGSHVLLNVAAMTGLLPLTGITLPLLSFGGTSMVFIAGAIGLVFQLSRYTLHELPQEGGAGYENSRSRRGSGGHVTPIVAILNALSIDATRDRFVYGVIAAFTCQPNNLSMAVHHPCESILLALENFVVTIRCHGGNS